MRVKLLLIMNITLLPALSWAGPSQCYSIKDQDLKNHCLAITKQRKSHCYSIKGNDLKNSCLAEIEGRKNRCYSIKDRDQKQRCLANSS
jgi:hypothetical protein